MDCCRWSIPSPGVELVNDELVNDINLGFKITTQEGLRLIRRGCRSVENSRVIEINYSVVIVK